jgi:hypothetical protein|tara:strand:- start:17177 stop:17704 length:528 start_codon:yes stop_codon:yes gene_type:complete
MDKVKNIEQAKVKKVITFLKNGGQLSIFSPYFLKHDVFYDIKGNALKFSDEVDPKSDPLFLIGNYYKKGYEQGWMLEGVPCVDSMCSIQMKADFITRWQYTTIKIVEIDRVEQSFKSLDEVQSYDSALNSSVFDCSYTALLNALKRAKLAINVNTSGTLTLKGEIDNKVQELACL